MRLIGCTALIQGIYLFCVNSRLRRIVLSSSSEKPIHLGSSIKVERVVLTALVNDQRTLMFDPMPDYGRGAGVGSTRGIGLYLGVAVGFAVGDGQGVPCP